LTAAAHSQAILVRAKHPRGLRYCASPINLHADANERRVCAAAQWRTPFRSQRPKYLGIQHLERNVVFREKTHHLCLVRADFKVSRGVSLDALHLLLERSPAYFAAIFPHSNRSYDNDCGESDPVAFQFYHDASVPFSLTLVQSATAKSRLVRQLLISRITGQVPYQDSTCPVSALIRHYAL
jgi:hypothetical protein